MIARGAPNLAKRDFRNLQTHRASLVGSALLQPILTNVDWPREYTFPIVKTRETAHKVDAPYVIKDFHKLGWSLRHLITLEFFHYVARVHSFLTKLSGIFIDGGPEGNRSQRSFCLKWRTHRSNLLALASFLQRDTEGRNGPYSLCRFLFMMKVILQWSIDFGFGQPQSLSYRNLMAEDHALFDHKNGIFHPLRLKLVSSHLCTRCGSNRERAFWKEFAKDRRSPSIKDFHRLPQPCHERCVTYIVETCLEHAYEPKGM
ncbi:hypothetical protein Tco_1083093 [Tanacetum coccineum]|uniref:Uncharacterized protein n=1 Tax=Tanacetum coccineum TaxID=301880 RepID=A0ABQ5I2B8_9ASTR